MSGDLKRAPAPTWTPLTALLRSLELGESGVLRVEVEILHCRRCGYVVEARELRCPECGADTCTDPLPLDQIVDLLDNDNPVISPPLRLGRYWVPERWWLSCDGLSWLMEYGSEDSDRPLDIPPQKVRPPSDFRPALVAAAWQPAEHMPRWATRLACEVGEARVREWCPECKGLGYVRTGEVRPGVCVNFDGERWHERCRVCAKDCPSCLGSPGPWWVYENVKRIEVE